LLIRLKKKRVSTSCTVKLTIMVFWGEKKSQLHGDCFTSCLLLVISSHLPSLLSATTFCTGMFTKRCCIDICFFCKNSIRKNSPSRILRLEECLIAW
jgi:hypothetical protein